MSYFSRAPVINVVRLYGAIGAGGRFGRGGLDDAGVAPLIERAFSSKRLVAVALAINSPGGAPAQASLIAGRIRDLAEQKQIPVIAFCEDVAASGGYMLACAADEIFAEENSIVGSIGVVSAGFGFHEAMGRLGVERRVQTAGEAKARLDPFKPLAQADTEWLATLQGKIHRNFIDMVRRSRGDRLGDDPALFSGEVWLGADAWERGLVDGLGRLRPLLRSRYGEKARFNVISPRRSFADRLGLGRLGVAAGDGAPGMMGAAVASAVEAAPAATLAALEERALWSRYGL